MYSWLRQYEFHFWLAIKLFFLLVVVRAVTLVAGLWTGYHIPAVDDFIYAVAEGYVLVFEMLMGRTPRIPSLF